MKHLLNRGETGGGAIALVEPRAVNPACTEPTLAGTSCVGPWQYRVYNLCYASAPNRNCGIQSQETCTDYQSCRDPAFGIQDHIDVETHPTAHGDPEVECTPRPVHCTTHCDPKRDNQLAAAAASQQQIGGSSNILWGCGPMSQPPRCTQTCDVTVQGVPRYNERAAPPCRIARQYQCNFVYNTCRDPGNGYDPAQCGYDPTLEYSAGGLTVDALAASFPHQPFVEPPSCTTCETLPMASAADVAAKYTCLIGRFQQNDPRDKARVVRNLKLLLELRGDQLAANEQRTIIDLYRTDPASVESCGRDYAPPAVDPSCGDVATLDATLVACNRLAFAHVPAPVVAALLPVCLATTTAIETLPDGATCHKADFRSAYHALSITLGKTAVSRPLPTATPEVTDLAGRLARLGAWYAASRAETYAGATDLKPLFVDTSEVLGAYWQAVHAPSLARIEASQLPGAPPLTAADLEDNRTQALEADRRTLLAALTPMAGGNALPLTSAPLALVVGDGLQALAGRASDLAEFHDLACQFKNQPCVPSQTKLASLVAILGALADATTLDAANRAAAAPLQADPWFAVFQALATGHAALEQAVVEATSAPAYSPSLLADAHPPGVALPIAPLAALLQSARARAASYAKVGLFDSTLRQELWTGIQEQNQNDIRTNFTSRTGQLLGAETSYQNALQTLVKDLVTAIHGQGDETAVKNQIAEKAERHRQLAADLDGLRMNAGIEEERFGEFMKSFNAVMTADSTDLQVGVERHVLPLSPISAANARYTMQMQMHREDMTITDLAVLAGGTPWTLSVKAGETVQIETGGNWAPTCAMQRYVAPPYAPSPEAAGDIDLSHLDVPDSLTGPEGFMLQSSGSLLKAAAYSTSLQGTEFTGTTDRTSLCGGLNLSLGVGAGALSEGASGSDTFCEESSSGWLVSDTSSQSQSQGTEARTSAMLTGGLRLPNTPFRRLPVGSLALVAMEHGRTTLDEVYSVRVLQRQSAFVPSHDVDLYLVENDLSDPACAQLPNPEDASLTPTVTYTKPLGSIIKQVGAGMAAALEVLHGETDRLVGQGRMLPQDVKSLHDQAYTQLRASCNCDPSQLPPNLLGLFDTWITKEAARIERLVEIQAVSRQAAIAAMELEAMRDDLERASGEARLTRLLPAWSLRNLDAEQLRVQTLSLVKLMNQQVYPIIHLRYPAVLNQVAASSGTELGRLRGADWSQSVLDLADAARLLATNVGNTLADTVTGTRHAEPVYLALRFPKPGTVPSNVPWRIADDVRSRAVWDGIAASGVASFVITPEDLYQRGGGAKILACTDTVPVIRSMVLYVVQRPGALGTAANNAFDYRVSTLMNQNLLFTNRTQADSYSISDDWRANPLHLVFGKIEDGGSVDTNTRLAAPQTANGLSSFTKLDVNLAEILPPNNPAGNPLSEAVELMLLYQVETLGVAEPGITWVGTCSQAQP